MSSKPLRALLTIPLLVLCVPALARAQVHHVVHDPNANTKGCQNHAAAFHDNGDVVMVEYFGQWRRLDDGRRIQNGGPKFSSCAIERVARIDPEGKTVWEIEPTEDAKEKGFANHDRLWQLQALPNGNTIMTLHEDISDLHMQSTILLLNKKGERLWRFQTKKAPRFSLVDVKVGDNGELFANFNATNYGYKGGVFQLPGGRKWSLKKHESFDLLARIDPKNGALLWEGKGAHLVSASGGELLLLKGQYKRGRLPRLRFTIQRHSYDGAQLSKGRTPWMTSERMLTAVRYGDKLVMTMEREDVDRKTRRVKERTGRLRAFNFKGKSLLDRAVSDGARLAAMSPGAPLRVISPTSCLRDVAIKYCISDALDVLTLKALRDKGSWSRLSLKDGRFHYQYLRAKSSKVGIWVSAQTYYKPQANADTTSPAVTSLYSKDSARAKITPPPRWVWRPRSAKPAKSGAKPERSNATKPIADPFASKPKRPKPAKLISF